MNEQQEQLYGMSLHQVIYQNHYEILKVEGGWIYTRYDEKGPGEMNMSSTFVSEIPETKVEYHAKG